LSRNPWTEFATGDRDTFPCSRDQNPWSRVSGAPAQGTPHEKQGTAFMLCQEMEPHHNRFSTLLVKLRIELWSLFRNQGSVRETKIVGSGNRAIRFFGFEAARRTTGRA